MLYICEHTGGIASSISGNLTESLTALQRVLGLTLYPRAYSIKYTLYQLLESRALSRMMVRVFALFSAFDGANIYQH